MTAFLIFLLVELKSWVHFICKAPSYNKVSFCPIESRTNLSNWFSPSAAPHVHSFHWKKSLHTVAFKWLPTVASFTMMRTAGTLHPQVELACLTD